MRLHAKRDDEEIKIANALRQLGATVHFISAPGIPDLLVSYVDKFGQSQTVLMEVKSKVGKLTPAQEAFMDSWQDHNVFIVRNVEEALMVLGF